jgi:hypothetical protein
MVVVRHRKKRLLHPVPGGIRVKHYSVGTGQSYVGRIRRCIHYHDTRHPKEMGADEIEEYLAYLAIERKAATSIKSQAPSALLFLCQNVFTRGLERPGRTQRGVSQTVITCLAATEENPFRLRWV